MAQKEEIIEINPYNSEHIKKIEQLESEDSSLDLSSKLKNIVATMSEDKYIKTIKKTNSIDKLFILEENKQIKGLFSISGEKDIRSCLITMHYTNHCQPKKILSIGAEYALKFLEMQEVFVKVMNTDNSTRKYLEEMGYEYLDEEAGEITYLRDYSILGLDGRIKAFI
ncbi:MAG: hypothetical protein IJI22_05090 [Bacilli bacterium]|nr:hypothetical protein [Bacilli bacterium]